MKAICIKQFKVLEGVLDEGDVVDIISIVSKKDMVISYKSIFAPSLNPFVRGKQIISTTPDVISPKGSFIDYKFKSKNGKIYSGACIRNAIGYSTLNKLFVKL